MTKVGRPSKYTQELQLKFDDMVGSLYSEDDQVAFDNYWKYGIIEQIAIFLNISIETIYDWSDMDSERYHKEFSESLKRWHISTKALLHKISPIIAEKSPALAIFLRKVKLKELEISKTILEEKFEANVKFENKTKVEIEAMMCLQDAESYGMCENDIKEVRDLLEQVKKTRSNELN